MRKHTPLVSASQPTPPTPNQHTHEVVIKRAGSTVVIKCWGIEAAAWEARFQQRHGEVTEILEVNHAN